MHMVAAQSPDRIDALETRLLTVTPQSPRQWGSMSPHEMICHLTDSFRAMLGQRPVSATPWSPLRRRLVAAGSAVGYALLIAIPTDLVDTPVRAALAQLEDDHGAAMKLAAKAEVLAVSTEAPSIHFEVACVRARVAIGRAERFESERQVDIAVRLAEKYHWIGRARMVRSEFGDLAGETCPFTFVRTRLALDRFTKARQLVLVMREHEWAARRHTAWSIGAPALRDASICSVASASSPLPASRVSVRVWRPSAANSGSMPASLRKTCLWPSAAASTL